MINKVFTVIEHFLFRSKVNPIATLYINFRCLPFKVARKLPVYIYGKINFQSLNGRIIVNSSIIKKGMITIGKRYCRTQGCTRLCIDGTLIVGDGVWIAGGTEVHIAKNATLSMGKNARIFEDSMVFCYNRIDIGDHTFITYHANIFDTDFHYCIDIETKEIFIHKKPIKLGKYNWIGNKVTIKKGTVTPDYTIVAAAYSLLNKDYTSICPPYPIIGGLPAKVLGSGKRRVFNWDNQARIDEYFAITGKRKLVYKSDVDTLCKFDE